MKQELKKVYNKLTEYFDLSELTDVSIVITGSINRGSPRVYNNKILSDVDILIIVSKKEKIPEIKEYLSKNPIDLNLKVSFIFTLVDKLRNNCNRGYLKEVSSESILYDKLQIEKIIENFHNCLNIDVEVGIVQELCYYYSKYNVIKRDYLKEKVLDKWKLLGNISETIMPTIKEIKEFVDKKDIPLLESSIFFLNNKIDCTEKTFSIVRNFVFIENQGLEFSVSYLEVVS